MTPSPERENGPVGEAYGRVFENTEIGDFPALQKLYEDILSSDIYLSKDHSLIFVKHDPVASLPPVVPCD